VFLSKTGGHTHDRKVLPKEEAMMTIRDVVDAPTGSNSDIVIVVHTDARQVMYLEEAFNNFQ